MHYVDKSGLKKKLMLVPIFSLTFESNPQRPTGSAVTQQVHDLCTEWMCLYFLCFALQGPVFHPWDTREVNTVAKLCVLWHFCPLANEPKLEFFCFLESILGL